MKTKFCWISWICLLALLATCATPPITSTLAPAPTYTATPFSDQACAWTFAYEPRPQLTALWREALAALNLPIISDNTFAQAFGENCNSATGSVRFATMEIDFIVTLNLNNFNDTQERATLVEPIMRVAVDSFPREVTNAPQQGRVEFHLISPTEDGWLRIQIRAAESAFAEGKTGIDFYNAVTTQP